jgi:hypothetical protein
MNLNNVFGYIAKSGAKVGIIFRNSNTKRRNEKDDFWVVIKVKPNLWFMQFTIRKV